MKFPGMLLLFVVPFVTPAQSRGAEQTNRWRAFGKTDGLAANDCASVAVGAGGSVIVCHGTTNVVSVLDGYQVAAIPAPDTNRGGIYESPGGQLWAVAPEGLLEFRDGEWDLHRVAEIAAHFRAGFTNAIALAPVRQGRVLFLLPDRIMQLDVDETHTPQATVLRRAEETQIGTFTAMTPADDGGLWIFGTRGIAKVAGPLRNIKADDAWVPTSRVPPELARGQTAAEQAHEILPSRVFDVAVEPGGAVWLAASDGLYRLAPALWTAHTNGDARAFPEAPRESSGSQIPADLLRQSPDRAANWTCFLIARNGDAWLGSTRQIAWRHHNAWKTFSSTNQIGPEGVIGFAEAPDGGIVCATPAKVWEFDGRNWLPLRGGINHVNGLFYARDGTLWVAANDGIHRFTRGAWVRNTSADGLPTNTVTALEQTASGEIIAHTHAGDWAFNLVADTDPPRAFVPPLTDPHARIREGDTVIVGFFGRDRWDLTAPKRLLFSFKLDEREWSPFEEISETLLGGLTVGRHLFLVRAMDSNANVSMPATLEFAVTLPWYRETRLVILLAIALVVALALAGLAYNRHRKLQVSYASVERLVAERTRELERANLELLHSQKMNALGTLAAGIAHDFNNILSIIKGSAQIIEDNPGDPGKIRTRVDRIKTVVEQGSGIVKAMLGFSSSDQQPGRYNLNTVVDDTVKLLGDRFLRQVKFERAASLPVVPAAKDFVQQILLNFIFNAAESMNSHKLVTLATRPVEKLSAGMVLTPNQAANYVAISVQDVGCGIPAENLPRIFEPFFTTKAMSTRRGTGLGLSMVYELAKKMGAGLAVESVVGQGSTFTLILPVNAEP